MILLTVEEIIMLHDKLLRSTGGAQGLRDRGLLESAAFSVEASFEDHEQYPTIVEKAARLAYALTCNHAFVDGNKRIGIYAMLVTLSLNELKPYYTQDELVDLGLGIADGRYRYEQVLDWLEKHIGKC